MFAPAEYQLVDFGRGRKLERFGPYLTDRPSPAAEGIAPAESEPWLRAMARFERTGADRGIWHWRDDQAPVTANPWTIRHGSVVLDLKTTPVGHLGVFPEQASNWDWLAEQIAIAGGRPKLLNLFAYTGAATLAAAAAGAEVVHVDAARNTVAWARRNAELSALADAPIRWIVDDAATFVRRELKRGNRYDAVVLDPPSFGHGAGKKLWKLADDLTGLVTDCARLLHADRQLLLLTCHTPGFGPRELQELLIRATGRNDVECGPLQLITPAGRALESGTMGRLSTFGRL
ncbi:MAG TPA: class I SAM-dependent methyltransferase [Pirellulales bacterium]|nr:class I SAM-dependent methyltransferase [Pirellulales bacterium]